MRGHKDAAVLARGRKTKEVVVLVNGAAHGAQAVVAVGQRVGNGKFLEAAGAGRLHNANIGNVVRGHGVKADAQYVLVLAGIVRGKNTRGEAVFAGGFKVHAFGAGFFGHGYAVGVDHHGTVHNFDHGRPSGVCGSLARRGLTRVLQS